MPAVALALPELLALAGLFLALGMVVMGDEFTKALFLVTETGIGWIPWVGKKAAGGVRAVGKRVNTVFSSAALKLEGAISQTWHVLASLIEQTGAAIWDATTLAAHAVWLYEVELPKRLALFLATTAEHAGQKAWARTQPVVKNYYTYKGVSARRFGDLLKRVTVLGAAVAALQHAIAHPHAIPRIGAPSLPISLKGIRARLSRLEARFGKKAFTAAVATALATLGVGWARRSCAKRNNDLLCSTNFDLLEGLLGGLVLIVSSVSLLNIARGMQEITDEAVGAVRSFIREASAADSGNAPARAIFGVEGSGDATALGFGVTGNAQRFGVDG